MKQEPKFALKTVEIDVEQGIYKVNGRDISNATYLSLIFDGVWSLEITENNVYSTISHNQHERVEKFQQLEIWGAGKEG